MRRIAMVVLLTGLVCVGTGVAEAQTTFWLDTPADGATVVGIVEVSGWVLDERGVSNVDLYVDDTFVAEADINIPRYDIIQAYPWFAGTPSSNPGFSTSFNGASVGPGWHDLYVEVTFGDSTTRQFGHREVFVDGTVNQVPFGELDLPEENQVMNHVFPVSGWALDDGDVVQIEILVDGQGYGDAVMDISRPDVANRFPGIAAAEDAGFLFNVNTSKLTNGMHTIAARLWDDEGASRIIGQRYVQVSNDWRNLVPFGELEWPLPDQILYAVGCDGQGGWSGGPYSEPRAVQLVVGWALDPDDYVKWVQLEIEGVPVLKTNVPGCWYWDWFGMEVNCYGSADPDQLREDIFKWYSDVDNAKHSQFTFALDVSDLIINHNFHQGVHPLTIRAGDFDGHQAEIATIPVLFDCNDDPDRPSFGDIYTPNKMELVSGTIDITGWAIDFDHIRDEVDYDGIEIWVDGEFMGHGEYRLPSPEVYEAYPWLGYSWANNVGFHYALDTTLLADTEHELVVITEDHWGSRTPIGQRSFVVDNVNDGADIVSKGLRKAAKP